MNLSLSHPTGILNGEISYGGSKSISNRVLIIQYLCQDPFPIENLSVSDDTNMLVSILENIGTTNDVHHAGTTFRFLTSLLSLKEGVQILTGSDRMKNRPIGPLVEALNSLGANIEYQDQTGYPPLVINSPKHLFKNNVSIDGSISSQYISSLLLIAPTLPKGLTITFEGELVSTPYVLMTLKVMEHFGINHTWVDNKITIENQEYIAKDFFVESDWSSASYFYSLAALSKETSIKITGLNPGSLQADAVIKNIGEDFNIKSDFDNGLLIRKEKECSLKFYEYDFLSCPDIAQTVFVMCAGKNINGLFSGLKTLKIKETNRIVACQQELQKIGVYLSLVPEKFAKNSRVAYYMLDGQIAVNENAFDTYDDHRMAMSFAPLALLGEIQINNAEVVSKSYPGFWDDLSNLGFEIIKR